MDRTQVTRLKVSVSPCHFQTTVAQSPLEQKDVPTPAKMIRCKRVAESVQCRGGRLEPEFPA